MEQNHQNLKLPEGIESGGMQKPHKANLLKKVLMLIVASSVFAFIGTSHGYAQTPVLNFEIKSDTIDIGTTATIRNLSTGWPSNTMFVWEIIDYYEQSHLFQAESKFDTTYSSTDSLMLPFFAVGAYSIVLNALDSNGVPSFISKILYVEKNLNCYSLPDACNSLPNGSFETEVPNSTTWSIGKFILNCCDWGAPIGGGSNADSPDYFHQNCGNNLVEIPGNWAGTQYPKDYPNETHYAGIFCKNEAIVGPSVEYREYISGSVHDCYGYSLSEGRKYVVGVYVSLAENSRYSSNIGIWLGESAIFQSFGTTGYPNSYFHNSTTPSVHFNLTPQIESTAPITNEADWTLVMDTIDGAFQEQIIIGNFRNDTDPNNYPMVNSTAVFVNPIQPGLGYQFYGSYFYIDHVFIEALHYNQHDTICIGECVTLTSSTTDYMLISGDGYMWNTIPTPPVTSPSITVCPKNDTLITCTVIDQCGCTIIDSFFIHIAPPPILPIVIGNRNNCDVNTTYHIENPQANCEYRWDIKDHAYSTYSFPQYGPSSINVHWNQLWVSGAAESTWMIVTVLDTLTGCSSKDSIRIWKCCSKNGVDGFINDVTISDNSIFSQNLFINGDLTINGTVTITTSGEIVMAPEARILVNPNSTFTVNTRMIKAGCNYMWDGIYVNDSTAKVVIQSNCTVQDAKNAIVSEHGGKFELLNSYFPNNYTSVLVRDYFFQPGFTWPKHKGKITGCTFAYSNPGLIAPYLGMKPHFGVYTDNVYALTIGDSTAANNRNTFRGLFCGIAGINSRLLVYNNRFGNIKPSSLCSINMGDYVNVQCETAIHSVETKSDMFQYNTSILNLGGTCATSRNTFDTINYGVYTYKTLSKLKSCIFSGASEAMTLRDFKFNSSIVSCTTQAATTKSVKIINTIPNALPLVLNIAYNTFTDPTYGIYLINVVSVPSAKTKIFNNTITLNGSATTRYGIYCNNSKMVEVYCNTISKTTAPAAANRLTVRGIQLDQCESATIRDNTTTRLGVGIKGAGYLIGTQFKCNTSDGNYNGFYFDAAYASVQTALSYQGTLALPNDNKWYNVPLTYYGIDAANGFALPTGSIWYYRTAYNFTISPTAILGLISKTGVGNPPQSSCTACGSMSMAGQSSSTLTTAIDYNETEIDNIISESNDYGMLDVPFKYFERQFAYNVLSNPILQTDVTFAEYYDELATGNIGKFITVLRMIQNEQLDSASTLNQSIAPQNQLEINRRWVNGVYLEYVAPQNPLPQSVIDELETLASSSPFVNGDAVYTARAIVGYTEATINPKSVDQENAESYASNVVVRVYPNPAQSTITVEVMGLSNELCIFAIRNTLGTKILEKTIQANGVSLDIDVSKLSNGIYFYELLNCADIKLYSNRLVIIK